MTETLAVRIRKGKKSLKELRKGKEMPAVFYGPKETSTPIAVETHTFKKIWRNAGESTVIELKGDGISKEALIYDVDFDPITGEPRHADFYVMEKGKKVTVEVPLEFIGVSPAVKELGGVLVKVLHDIKIEVLPKDLPRHIEVDVSPLVTFESKIFVKDIVIPARVVLLSTPDEVVALVNEVKEEEEIVPEPVSIEDIEVEKKGKQEEETESSADAPVSPAEQKIEKKEKK
ncbi:50S ribosomal protein L25 [Candidatus Kaiserbacteria bacterium]|nr:50S ribosomal protein L25 [Candidatus Kaiserbacteria bacterium]